MSWAYYLTRATNMLAGSRILENVEEEMEKEGHGLKTGSEKYVDEIALTMSSTEIMDNLKPKVDLILLRGNRACICDCRLWLQQFKNLVNFQDLGKCGPFYLIIHFLSLPWKFLAAFIPPASTLGGIVPLMMSWGSIFFILPFIYDIVSHLDCFILCQDSLAGFILVSITLNLPNLLADCKLLDNFSRILASLVHGIYLLGVTGPSLHSCSRFSFIVYLSVSVFCYCSLCHHNWKEVLCRRGAWWELCLQDHHHHHLPPSLGSPLSPYHSESFKYPGLIIVSV